jgi:hypothetical protein
MSSNNSILTNLSIFIMLQFNQLDLSYFAYLKISYLISWHFFNHTKMEKTATLMGSCEIQVSDSMALLGHWRKIRLALSRSLFFP